MILRSLCVCVLLSHSKARPLSLRYLGQPEIALSQGHYVLASKQETKEELLVAAVISLTPAATP